MFEVRMKIMPQTFVIVGCGGTGSRLVPILAQFIKTCPWIVDPTIFLVDDDVVEQKNLQRQNFITPDVGKPKAEVLASRYSKAYNITIIPVVERVTSDRTTYDRIFNGRVESPIKGNVKSAMIISCVDNMEARRNILSTFNNVWAHNGIFLDGGNEDLYGQVMISNPYYLLMDNYSNNLPKDVFSMLNLPELMPVSADAQGIPLDCKFYATTMDKPSERSCADLDQTMAINAMVAITMFSMIQTVIYSRPFNFNRLNISMAGTFPEMLSLKNIARMSINRDEFHEYNNTSSLRGLFSNVYAITIAEYAQALIGTYSKFITEKRREEEKKKREEEAAAFAAAAKEQNVKVKPDYSLEEAVEAVVVPAEPPPLTAIPRRRTRLEVPVNVLNRTAGLPLG